MGWTPLWAELLRVMLFGAGLLYAMTSLLGEYFYSNARQVPWAQGLVELRRAAAVFPLNYRFRIAPVVALHDLAVKDPQFQEAVLAQVKAALAVDPTAPGLLVFAINLETDLGKHEDAKAHYEMFKRVAKLSPLAKN